MEACGDPIASRFSEKSSRLAPGAVFKGSFDEGLFFKGSLRGSLKGFVKVSVNGSTSIWDPRKDSF